MSDKVTVVLYRPDGGTTVEVSGVEVTNWTKDMIEFRQRIEDDDNDEVLIRDYTSNLPYLIIEETRGPKSLL